MRITTLFGCLVVAASGVSAKAQVYSENIVGYYNLALSAGNSLIANQLATGDDTLDTIFPPDVPEGSTFTEWDPATQQYLPTSVYDTVTGWSINFVLGYGQGGLINTPTPFTTTFVGSVWPGFSATSTFVPPVVSGSGWMLLSDVIPIAPATFYDVVGRDPQNGESVTTLDGPSQTLTTTTFDDGVWNNGTPGLTVGESAFFDLNPASDAVVSVPEPTISGLAALGLAVLAKVGPRRRPGSPR